MHFKSCVESNETRRKCVQCREGGSVDHCHYSLAQITTEMRENCKKAKSRIIASQQEAYSQKESDK